jgi:hypothetical protein
MGYDKFCRTFYAARQAHLDDPEMLAVIDQFGKDAAYLRMLDERTAALQARLAIADAQGLSGCDGEDAAASD